MSSRSIPNEASQLTILKSDASQHDKAIACQHLVYVAGPKSVGPLAALLADEHLSDYARSALEAIDDPAASKAMLDSLSQLKDRQLAGAINSLGIRREKTAVPMLKKLSAEPNPGVQAATIASLGMIGTPDAAMILESIIAKGEEPLRTQAGHAGLMATEHLAREENAAAATKLVDTLKSAFPKGPINAAASHQS